MKKNIFSLLIIFIAAIPITVTSCKKENKQPGDVASAVRLDEAIASSQKLVLQPGPDEGQDAFVSRLLNDTANANTNFNDVHELAILKWTIEGLPVTQRSFIKFTGLSVLPDSAKIVSATLFLYGISNSFNHPQGNSVYPGSPYIIDYPDNSCVIRGVLQDWDEATITWNNQPASSNLDTAIIVSSSTQWLQTDTVDVTRLVQKMVRKHEFYGFNIRLIDENIYRSQQFSVSENEKPFQRPKLVVFYK